MFYFLKDKELLQAQLWKIVPIKMRAEIHLLFIQINHVINGFLLGSLIVVSFVSSFTTSGFMFSKFDFALVFG